MIPAEREAEQAPSPLPGGSECGWERAGGEGLWAGAYTAQSTFKATVFGSPKKTGSTCSRMSALTSRKLPFALDRNQSAFRTISPPVTARSGSAGADQLRSIPAEAGKPVPTEESQRQAWVNPRGTGKLLRKATMGSPTGVDPRVHGEGPCSRILLQQT